MKEEITFEKDSYIRKFTYSEEPIVNVGEINFITDEENWAPKLYPGSILVTIECFDINLQSRGKNSFSPISFIALISVYNRNPVLEFNNLYKYPVKTNNEVVSWTLTMELKGVELADGEKIKVSVMDKVHVEKRVIDWEKRILDLYKDVGSWLSPLNLRVQQGRSILMHEGLMKTFEVNVKSLPLLDVYSDSTFLLSFRPMGLWIMGANGRVDILTLKAEGFILIDKAEQFTSPQWYLVDKTKQELAWSKDTLVTLIKSLQ